MPSILPSFSASMPFSATMANSISRHTRALKGAADAARPASKIIVLDEDKTGWVVHGYDTLRYSVTHDGSQTTTLKYGGASVVVITGAGAVTGSFSMESASITEGAVYSLTATPGDAEADNTINYVYEELVETYGSGACSFVDAMAASDVATVMNSVVDQTDNLINMANAPAGAIREVEAMERYWKREEDSELVRWTGWLRHIHNRGDLKFRHSIIRGGGLGNTHSKVDLYINGGLVVSHATGNRAVVSPVTSKAVRAVKGTHGTGQSVRAEEVAMSVDISGLGLTTGSWYKWEIRQHGSGTDHGVDFWIRLLWAGESACDPSRTEPPVWVYGASNITASRLNDYDKCIDELHQSASAPVTPIYYDNLFQWVDDFDDLYMNRRKKYLVYRKYTDRGRPELTYAGGRIAIKNEDNTNMWTDLDKIHGLSYGMRFWVDDVDYAFQVGDVSEI